MPVQDPEGLLSAPQGGHISRRQLTKEVENNKELQAEVDRLKAEKEAELKQQRDVRKQSPFQLFLRCPFRDG